MKKIFFVAVISLFSTHSYALFCANCANTWQMAAANTKQAQSYLETVKQTLNSVKSLQNEAQSIAYQFENLKNLKQHNWGDALNQIDKLGRIAREGQALSYSLYDLNSTWNERFKGYEGWAGQEQTNREMTQKYKEWGDTMRDTAKSSLKVAQEMARIQEEDETTITQLQQNSSASTGALTVAQAGNEIAAQTTRQLQKMQTLMQTDIQMTATNMALASEKQEQRQAATDAMIASPDELKTNIHNGKDWSKLW
ncbi:P-type conjugative transfer protein TrbJ [Photobacterium sp. NCIMB 13483]|uniref:P-type conjugative transfer protein TrbJ n=1 Tax=Photobacterium sp. NCIMB 13483 TaxID=2022103 RepID=UPI000D16B565|nr:P-type conjugative transfer protein TrbJ [Photobacterium sp. NCIMB 13483]PST87304.1 P-type conjugative transfer protein TrbJ [Photobacterium sp. NCIMB 13483]